MKKNGWMNDRKVIVRNGQILFQVEIHSGGGCACAERIKYVERKLSGKKISFSFHDGFLVLNVPKDNIEATRYLSDILDLEIETVGESKTFTVEITDTIDKAMDAESLCEIMNYAVNTHNTQPIMPRKAFRKWDERTPYGIHPIWCAMTILHETSSVLSELRHIGAEVLLLHDILEDTTAGLPEETDKGVRRLVDQMTFASTEEEMRLVWERQPFIRLLKLYDKVSNLMDGAWMSDELRAKYAEYTRKLADDAEENFGKDLNILKIARALVS